MTKVSRAWRLRIHDAGTATPTDGTVDFVLDKIAEVPSYGFQRMDPLRGSAETRPWRFRVVDDGTVVGNLGDATTGRPDLLGRLVEVQLQEDGGAWSRVAVGRLADLSEDSPQAVVIDVSDERWFERRARPVTVADTAQLWPPGIRYPWRGFVVPATRASYELAASSGALRRLSLFSKWPVSYQVQAWLQNDLRDERIKARTDGQGNFQHLRVEIDGTDYPVVSLNRDLDEWDMVGDLTGLNAGSGARIDLWIYASVAPSSTGTAALWAPSAPPSETLPAHIGTDPQFLGGATHALGYSTGYASVWELVQTLYDEVGVRYDAAAFAALPASPHMAFRITEPLRDLATWLDERVYGPLQVAPFIDTEGRISPRSIRLPDAGTFSVSTAFEFNAGNLSEAPSWENAGTDVANIFEYEYDAITQVGRKPFQSDPGQYLGGQAGFTAGDWPGDGMLVERRTERVEHDNVSTLGEFVVRHDLSGIAPASEVSFFGARLGQYVPLIAQELFDRYGDGPQRGTFRALRKVQDGSARTPEDVEAGDFVILNVGTYPNVGTLARGGARVVQIISRQETADGLAFEFLDAGPNLQALATPSVSIAQGADTYHSVDVTVSSTPTGATTTVELDLGTDGVWGRKIVGLGNGTVTVSGLPSGTTIRARAQAATAGRTRSSWSSIVSVATSSLTAPTPGTPTVSTTKVTLPWSGGTSGYSVVALSRVNGATDWVVAGVLPIGSTQYTYVLSQAGTLYDLGLKLRDPYGGESSVATTSATTGSSGTLTAPSNLRFIQGEDTGDEGVLSGAIRYGIEIAWASTEPLAQTRIQVDESNSFPAPLELVVAPGVTSTVVDLPLDATLRYVRVRHEQEGATSSAWSSTVTAYPGGIAGSVVEQTAGSLEALTDTSISGTPTGKFLYYASGSWVDASITSGDLPTHEHAAGDITSGTLGASRGGTGQSSYATGDLLYSPDGTSVSKLAVGTNGQILRSNGTLPTWGAVPSHSHTLGDLQDAGDGTGSGPLIAAASGGAESIPEPTSAGQYLKASTAGPGATYTWDTPSSSGVSSVSAGDALSGGGTGAVTLHVTPYSGTTADRGQTAIESDAIAVVLGTGANEAAAGDHGLTSHVESGLTAGHVLRATGATSYAWGALQSTDLPAHTHSGSQITIGTVTAVVGGTGITSYATGDLLYASDSTTLTKLSVGSNGQVLGSNGTIPGWTTPATGATDLDGLSDVTITTPSAAQTLRYNGTDWVNSQLASADIWDFASSVDGRLDLTQTIAGAWIFSSTVGVQDLLSANAGLALGKQIYQDGFYSAGTNLTGTFSPNWDNGNSQRVTVGTGSLTIAPSQTSAKIGTAYTLHVGNQSGASRTISWTSVNWVGGTAPTASLATGRYTLVQFVVSQNFSGTRRIVGSVLEDNVTP